MRRWWKRTVVALTLILMSCAGVTTLLTQNTYADDGGTVTCTSSGAAESLGWIVCPIMDMIGEASTGLYDTAVKPALTVKPQLFTGEGEATRTAWGTFRDIANGLLIILFLVVIFSQLTGVGIDNYGIKKILPKIIIAAILMNLSYWVCIVFVDLSNIIGNSIEGLFNGLGESLAESFEIGDGVTAESLGTTLVSVAVIAALVTGGGYALFANPAMLLAVFVGAIGVIVSIFFLFILLAVREAAIVVLVVLSPIAIACYMLPNTKSIFDKWLKLFEALLLVYPICSLLVGGGNYVSRLLLTIGFGDDGKFFGAITAMVVGIVPIFFFPTILKNAFAGMGNIGAKITGIGDKVGGRLQGAAKNSERYKNAQRMGLERQTRIRAGLDTNGNLTERGKRRVNRWQGLANGRLAQNRVVGGAVKGMAVGMQKATAANIEAAQKNMGATEDASASLINAMASTEIAEEYGGDAKGYYVATFRDAAEKGDIAGMNGALAAAVASGYMKDKDIAAMVRDAQNDGVINIDDPGNKAAWMRDTASKYGRGFMATDFELQHFMQGGGLGNGGNLGGYGEYAGGNIGVDDLKPEDVNKLSGDSLAGLAAAGTLTPAMAQQVLAKNPNISADKRVMLGAVASGATVGADGRSTITDANTFKEEAKALMNNPNAVTWTDKDGNTHDITNIHAAGDADNRVSADQVSSWTAPTPVAANVVQDFSSGYGGQHNPVEVTMADGGGGGAGATIDGAAAGAAAGGTIGGAAGGATDGAAAAAAIDSETTLAAAGAGDTQAAGQNSGELTIEHDDNAPRATAAAAHTQSRQPQPSAATAAEAAMRSGRAEQSGPRLEIAHDMRDGRLSQERRRVDAENQGNRRWPGNPQTPRGI